MDIRVKIERLHSLGDEFKSSTELGWIEETLSEFVEQLSCGNIQATCFLNGMWITQSWVIDGITSIFRYDHLCEAYPAGFPFREFNSLNNVPAHAFQRARAVPYCSIRNGAYLGKGVICMPSSFVNVGAYVDDESMVDSQVCVGSGARIGKRVHLGSGTVIGGVLEPPGVHPVVIEDRVFVGALSLIAEGVIVGHDSAIAAGTKLSSKVPVLDERSGQLFNTKNSERVIIPPCSLVLPAVVAERNIGGYRVGIQGAIIRERKRDNNEELFRSELRDFSILSNSKESQDFVQYFGAL
jgi:2,3,4,5-tetrahydropyridine-2-carboxylate N-succinyltransferase